MAGFRTWIPMCPYWDQLLPLIYGRQVKGPLASMAGFWLWGRPLTSLQWLCIKDRIKFTDNAASKGKLYPLLRRSLSDEQTQKYSFRLAAIAVWIPRKIGLQSMQCKECQGSRANPVPFPFFHWQWWLISTAVLGSAAACSLLGRSTATNSASISDRDVTWLTQASKFSLPWHLLDQ